MAVARPVVPGRDESGVTQRMSRMLVAGSLAVILVWVVGLATVALFLVHLTAHLLG